MLSKNPPAINAVLLMLKPISCQSNTKLNNTVAIGNTVSVSIANNLFHPHPTTVTSNTVFMGDIATKGFAVIDAFGDKLGEDKMVEEKFGRRNLYSRSIINTSLTSVALKSGAMLVTDASVSEVEYKHNLPVTTNNFFCKNEKKNLLEMNTVVIGKNTS